MSQSVCIVCNMPAGLRCKECKKAYYCSQEHSTTEWKEHRGQCKGITALLFPMHEDRPRLVKVTYTRQKDQGSGVTKLPDFTPWLPCKWRDQRLITSHGMQGRGRPLGRTLQMEFNDDYMAERSPINRCVQAVTNGEAEKWGDNILVFRRKGSNNYADATMDDVEPMVAYFKDYNWKNLGYESPEAARKLSIQMLDPSMFV